MNALLTVLQKDPPLSDEFLGLIERLAPSIVFQDGTFLEPEMLFSDDEDESENGGPIVFLTANGEADGDGVGN